VKIKIIIEVLLLLHLVAAFPMQINPPNQHFEEMLNIPKSNSTFFNIIFPWIFLKVPSHQIRLA
jgi:hypothetical protein